MLCRPAHLLLFTSPARLPLRARAGDLLSPDEVTFTVLLRGYGECDPPRWSAIGDLLDAMERNYGIAPTTGAPLAAQLPRPAAVASDCSSPSRLAVPDLCLARQQGARGCVLIGGPLPPAAATFNVLLEAASRTNDQGRAEELIGRMRSAGLQPNEYTTSAVRQRKAMRSMLRRTFG